MSYHLDCFEVVELPEVVEWIVLAGSSGIEDQLGNNDSVGIIFRVPIVHWIGSAD